ncbi:MAG: TIGR03960 family B12-binding radical SAM protein, partial [Lachnospiraceae bacterium]|nr:TIGR03960 family B12-binding radical SAM protein [Lachnospiraceae bacterium]
EMNVSDTYYPLKPVVPFIKVTQDRVTLEIQRGCIRGCRFCQAGMLYRPVRERDVELLKDYAVEMLENTGHEEISLSSLSSSDYTHLEELVGFLVGYAEDKKLNISLPSLRIDAFSLDVMSRVQDIRKSSLTFAPEAGSQRLRNVINKGLTREDILNGASQAFLGGWTRVKLYFMLGLPTETEDDMRGIAELSNDIAKLYYELIPKQARHGRVQIVSSSSFFVPKPFTPFQWASMNTKEQFLEKAHFVNDCMHEQLNSKSIKYNYHEADVSILEGVFARGDRKLCRVLKKAYDNGCLFDAWTETFREEPWIEAFEECNISMDFYTSRQRSFDEILPWDMIDAGVSRGFLKREWERAVREEVTPNCRKACSGCGALVYGGGVCYENKDQI